MSIRTATIGPRFNLLGKAAFAAIYLLACLAGALAKFHSPHGTYAKQRRSMRQKLERARLFMYSASVRADTTPVSD